LRNAKELTWKLSRDHGSSSRLNFWNRSSHLIWTPQLWQRPSHALLCSLPLSRRALPSPATSAMGSTPITIHFRISRRLILLAHLPFQPQWHSPLLRPQGTYLLYSPFRNQESLPRLPSTRVSSAMSPLSGASSTRPRNSVCAHPPGFRRRSSI
jgi:hypothetical protein